MFLISTSTALLSRDTVRRWLTLLAAIAALLSSFCLPLGPDRLALAQTPSPHVSGTALKLPRSAFPPRSVIQGRQAANQAADAASKLHTAAFAGLGRIDGYLETAWWWIPGRAHPLTIQYAASIFSSSDEAAAAYSDARASLWEIGRPLSVQDATHSSFGVTERDGHEDVYTLLHAGSIESELRLRYESSVDHHSAVSALWYLGQAVRAATHLATSLTSTVPPVTTGTPSAGQSAAPGSPAPATPSSIFVAPWGTGPVVKSPSLMVLDESNAPGGTELDPGAYRAGTDLQLTGRVMRHPALVPGGSLSRYVRTASVGNSGAWYEATALYPGVGSADQAFVNLAGVNRSFRWLDPFDLSSQMWNVGPLRTVDTARAWQTDGEIVIAIRQQNVLVVVAVTGQKTADLVSLVDRILGTLPSWLQAKGTQIVDAGDDPVHLAALNWYGAEQQDFVVGGLDFRSYQDILQTIRSLGYNSVRLPFSNQLVEQNPVVTAHLGANTDLQGLHALDILDRIVSYAGALGLSVILDNHRSDAGWSSQENGLWYTPAYPDAAFVNDWATMARRYAVNDVVVGADLRNEPHGQATWGDSNAATDWKAAAERAGNAALAANPHLLIIVEGVQMYGQSASYWWGGSLLGVATAPVVLHFVDGSSARSQLVYSAHDYGPDNCGSGCPWFNSGTTYDTLSQVWEEYWGYITDDPTKPYAAPVWVGEFGTCNTQLTCVSDATPGSQGQWFSSLVRYIAAKHLSWAYWSANGTESTSGTRIYGNLDWYGLLTKDWSGPIPWLHDALRTIQTDGAPAGQAPSSPPGG